MVDMVELELPRFEYCLETGARSLRDGIVVTFFMPGNHQQVSPFVRTAIDLYLSLPGVTNNLGTIDEDGYPVMLDAQNLKDIIAERLEVKLKEAILQIIDSTEGASIFSIKYYGCDPGKRTESGWPNLVSGISFTFPTDFSGETGLLEMFTFANKLTMILPFSFGYVSPAFIYHEGVGEPAAFEMIRGLSRRYLCLDIPALLPDCFELGEGIKGVYWGNYLSQTMLKQLGGEAVIRDHFLGRDVRVELHDGGSISVYLSRVPLAGDVNRREDISAYKLAFKLFGTLMLARSINYLKFDEEAMLKWLHRFDTEQRK